MLSIIKVLLHTCHRSHLPLLLVALILCSPQLCDYLSIREARDLLMLERVTAFQDTMSPENQRHDKQDRIYLKDKQ